MAGVLLASPVALLGLTPSQPIVRATTQSRMAAVPSLSAIDHRGRRSALLAGIVTLGAAATEVHADAIDDIAARSNAIAQQVGSHFSAQQPLLPT
jgi:hypothetical protein